MTGAIVIIGFSIIILLVSISRVNRKKAVLNDEDKELFVKYRGMIDNKFKRPDGMSEYELKIWELAIKDKEVAGEKKFWIGAVFFGIVLFIACLVANMF